MNFILARRGRLPEALAHMRNDSILSIAEPRVAATKSRAKGKSRFTTLPRQASTYAGAAFATAMIAVVVNALVLQHERHPSPFFGASAEDGVARPVEHTASPSVASTSAPVSPPPRPTDLAGSSEAANAHASDPIGDVLRGPAVKDNQKLVASAQTSLAKLGYVVKTNGVAGAETMTALRDFEKSHGMPVSTDITPRLVKQLSAAAASR